MIQKFLQNYRQLSIQVRASFWFFICAFMQKAISCITTPIFTRILTTAEYGKFNVFTSWMGIFQVVVSLNLWGGVYMQGMVKFEKKRLEYSSALQGLMLTLTVGWTLIYATFHSVLNKWFSLTTVQMLCMILLIWTSSTFSFWASEQRVDFKYRSLVIVTIVVSMAKPLIGILLVLCAKDKVTARIMGLLFVEGTVYTWCFISQMRRGKHFCSMNYWKYALGFNLPLIPHYLSMTVLNGSDRIMISNMVGESEAGIYSLAYSVSLIMTMFNTALLQTIEPWIYKKIKAGEVRKISKVAYPAFCMIACVNLGLIALAPEVIAIFAPSEYYDARWVIPPVAMSVYFMFLYTFFATFEFYFEKTKLIAVASLIGAFVNLILNYVFINAIGYYAAGYTTLISYILYALFHYYFMKKICKDYLENCQPYHTGKLLCITMLFMAASFVLLYTYSNDVLRYTVILICLLLVMVNRKSLIRMLKSLMQVKAEIKNKD